MIRLVSVPLSKVLRVAIAAGLGLWAGAAWAQGQGTVTSFHGRTPTAEEIVQGLVPGGMPEGLVPEGAAPAEPVGHRGLSVVSPASAPAAASPPRRQQQHQPAAAAPLPCPAVGNAVALEINFARGSAQFDPEARRTLDEVARALLSPQLAGCRFAVEGHTDATGTPQGNQALSERRAGAVRAFLIRRQIDPGRLQAVGKGQSEPLNAADPYAAENRRVQFRLLGG